MLHAANQDLPCLAEIGLVPARIFDTELAARLAGLPRVGLGAVVESLLGFSLQKGHSAADWSTRPLPEEWLVYAALDVEVLVDLRDALDAILAEQGKSDWARQEFEAILAAGPPGAEDRPVAAHLRHARAAAAAASWACCASLWQARDDMARRRDVAPGRVLPDSAMVAAVQADPAHEGRAAGAAGLPGPRQPQARGHLVRRPGPRAGRSRTASCRCTAGPVRGRRRSTAGTTATRPRPPGCRPRAPGWPSCRRSTPCRWRTSSPPTSCAG